jgi:hypothetical protein
MVSRAVSPFLQRWYGNLRVIEIFEVRSGVKMTALPPGRTSGQQWLASHFLASTVVNA